MKEWFEKKNYFMEFADIKSEYMFGTGGGQNDHRPLVTVAIPGYKRTELLKESIDSILCQQDFTDYEILVVDDYPDENPEMEKMMLTYTQEHPNISYYRNSKNMGMGGNWNRCIELARAEWVVLLHDDDMLCKDYLKTVYPIAVKSGCTLLGTFSYQMNCLQRNENDVQYSHKLEKSKAVLSKLRRERPFRVKKNDLLNFIQPSPGCWMINRKANLEFGGYDALRKKSGLIDGPFNFKNTYHGKTIIVPKFLFVRRIKENDFLNVEAQTEILTGLYKYIRHYAENHTVMKKINKWIVDISILNFAKGIKAKYKAEIDTAAILKGLGVSKVLLHFPNKLIYILNMIGLGKLVLRRSK